VQELPEERAPTIEASVQQMWKGPVGEFAWPIQKPCVEILLRKTWQLVAGA
jgi:hypothetical protein